MSTPDKRLEELDWNDRFADSLSLSDDVAPEHSPQISPASVLPTATTSPMKVAEFETSAVLAKKFSLVHCVLAMINSSMWTCLVDLIPSICPVMQTLLDRSQSLQNYMDNNSPTCQAAEFQKLRHQHAQLLHLNHVLTEESNHRLVDHAELMSEVKLVYCTFKANLAGNMLLAAAFLLPIPSTSSTLPCPPPPPLHPLIFLIFHPCPHLALALVSIRF